MQLVLKQSGSVLAIALASLAMPLGAASAQDTATSETPAGPQPGTSGTSQVSDNGVIIVSGVRQSIESSIDDKRRATEIKDSVTAEDIGQLANDNISEALQRITGVQVTRSDDGEGQDVQIRGLSENNVQLNGETISGTAAERGVNFQDLPAELFSGVEILKTATADAIEGSLGGTINLKTRAPLDGRKDFVFNASATHKYAEVGELNNNDASVFVIKQFRDTGLGDFGVLLNFGYKESASVAEVYGGGDYETAPAIWVRHYGGASYPTGGGNLFSGAKVSGQPNAYRYDFAVDPNGDGSSDANDIYYLPNQFGFFERNRDDRKKSFNGTLEWRPASNLKLRFDTVLTDITENLTGSRYSINFNAPRQGPLINGPGNSFSLLEHTPAMGDVYVMDAGRLGAATNRVGAAPSVNTVARDSQQFSLDADWDITPSLNLYVKGSTSRGKASTIVQGQLQTGIEHQGAVNSYFDNQDFMNVVDYNLGTNLIPDVTFYESPFPAPNYGVTSQVPLDQLVALNPADINYVRQRYFQFQRNAADTKNTDDSVRFDLKWKPQAGFFTSFQAGFRWAQRSFERASYQNSNQGGAANPSTKWDGVSDPTQLVNIQRIPVDPTSTTDQGYAATAEFLQGCLTTAGREGLLANFGGNLPTVWGSTAGCNTNDVADYFHMLDIRALNEATGAGYYEITGERFDVTEQTTAAYVRADFVETVFDTVEMYGNVGVRYVRTKTSSSGYIRNDTNTGWDFVTLHGDYDDWLPSVNVNFALTDNLILRGAYSRTMGRPGLALISPALDIQRQYDETDYAGFGTAGNPNLKPVHSDNFDGSLEWYYDKGSFMSVAVFEKDIDSTIFLSSDPVDYVIGGELFSIRTYQNFAGTKIQGVELGMAHAFNYLPGILSNLGVTANYTIVDEKSDLRDQEGDPIGRRGLSDKTLNLGAYYDDGRFSIRVAYNKRSAFTRRENVSLGFGRPETLPEIEDARDQLDLAVRFKLNRYVRFTFNAINLTNTGTVRYMKYPQLVNYLAYAGRRFNFGVSFSY